MMRKLHFVFDAFPSPEGSRFIELEDDDGFSINYGEWMGRADGLVELVIDDPRPQGFNMSKEQTATMVPISAVQARLREMARNLLIQNTAENERSAAFHMSNALRTAAIHLGNEVAALGDHRND